MSEEASFAPPAGDSTDVRSTFVRTHPARVIAETIDLPADAVYDFACVPANLPQWASGLATGISEEPGGWYADSPMGRIRVELAPRNALRVLDHDVTLPDGQRFHNAMRVTPSGDGCVVAFVLLRMPDVTDDDFERDAAHVARDLRTLKALLENHNP